jgi:hypothetical protein
LKRIMESFVTSDWHQRLVCESQIQNENE